MENIYTTTRSWVKINRLLSCDKQKGSDIPLTIKYLPSSIKCDCQFFFLTLYD